MITGIGSDMMRIADVAKAHKKMGWTMVHQFLGPMEIEVISNMKGDKDEMVMYLARRLAAKEAFTKAMDDPSIDVRTVQILNEANGRPYFVYNERYGTVPHLTLTDCGDFVLAVVVLEYTK